MQDSQINTFTGGMNIDASKETLEANQYVYAENIKIMPNVGGDQGTVQPFDQIERINLELNPNTKQIIGACEGFVWHDDKKKQCYILLTLDKDESNSLYVYAEDGDSLKLIKELHHSFGISTPSKILNLYENQRVSRVYICNNSVSIQVVNINDIKQDQHDFSMFPKIGILPPFLYDCEIQGSLKGGKYQYCYQLYSSSGQQSALSAMSALIPIGEQNDIKSKKGLRIRVEIHTDQKQLNRIKIFCLKYPSAATMVPQVFLVHDGEIDINSDHFVYNHVSNDSDTSHTLEELQAIRSAVFNANTIAVAQNRLIAGGIYYKSFEVHGFDGRVYPADLSGNVALYKSPDADPIFTQQYKIVNGDFDVDVQLGEGYVHNVLDPEKYKYLRVYGAENINSGQLPYGEEGMCGGAGPCVAYEIIRPTLDLAPVNDSESHAVDPLHNHRFISVSYNNDDYHELGDITLPQIGLKTGSTWQSLAKIDKYECDHEIKKLSYEDTYIATNLVGFKQGEYYSFGIVFYDFFGNRTSVFPIGDIHIPRFKYWTFGGVKTDRSATHSDLMATTVGIRFRIDLSKIANKDQIAAYEIVREDKTNSNRLVLCQGIMSNVFDFWDSYSKNKQALTNANGKGVDFRSPIAPTVCSSLSCVSVMTDLKDGHKRGVLYKNPGALVQHTNSNPQVNTFTSPEISINGDDVKSQLDNISGIIPVNIMESLICDRGTDQFHIEDDQIFYGNVCFKQLGFPYFSYVKSAVGVSGKTNQNSDATYEQYTIMGRMFHVLNSIIAYFDDPQPPSINRTIGYAPYHGTSQQDSPWSTLLLYKYYMPCNESFSQGKQHKLQTTSAIHYVDKLDPRTQLGQAAKNTGISLNSSGNNYYINTTMICPKSDARYGGQWGLHGNCLIIEFDQNPGIVKFLNQQTYQVIDAGGAVQKNERTINYSPLDVSNSLFTNEFPQFRRVTSQDFFKYTYSDKKISDTQITWSPLINRLGEVSDKVSKVPEESLLYASKGMRFVAVTADLRTKNRCPFRTKSSLSNIVYNSHGNYHAVTGVTTPEYINCFGGDTYVCIHKELYSSFGTSEQANAPDYSKYTDGLRASSHVFYPVETRINLGKAFGANFTNSDNPFLVSFEDYFGANGHTLLNMYGDFNSADAYNIAVTAIGEFELINQIYGNRLLASNVKEVGQIDDNFQQFHYLNYVDLDASYGDVTNLIMWQNKLHAFQELGVSVVHVNEKAIVQSSTDQKLLLGEGDVLSDPQYISTLYGVTLVNDTTILGTPGALYWYDLNKKTIVVCNNNGVNNLAAIGNVQTVFKKFDPVWANYDSFNREVLFSTLDRCIVYNENIGKFTTFVTRSIQFGKPFGDSTVFVDNGELFWLKLTEQPDIKPDQTATVKFVVNKDPSTTKVFDTVQICDTFTPNSSQLLKYNIKYHTNSQGDSTIHPSGVAKEGIYYQPVGRNANLDRMRDTSMLVTLQMSSKNKFNISSIKTTFRKSNI